MNNTYKVLERSARKWVEANFDSLPDEVIAFFFCKSQIVIEHRSFPELE